MVKACWCGACGQGPVTRSCGGETLCCSLLMLCSYLLLHLCLAYCVCAEGHMHVVRDLLLSGADWRLRSVRSFFLSLSLFHTHTHCLSLSFSLSLSLSHARTHTPCLSLSLFLSLSLSSLSLSLSPYAHAQHGQKTHVHRQLRVAASLERTQRMCTAGSRAQESLYTHMHTLRAHSARATHTRLVAPRN